MQLFDRVAGQRFQREREISIVVELTTLVIGVELPVSLAERGLVDDAVFDHVFSPEKVAVPIEQGMVEIE